MSKPTSHDHLECSGPHSGRRVLDADQGHLWCRSTQNTIDPDSPVAPPHNVTLHCGLRRRAA